MTKAAPKRAAKKAVAKAAPVPPSLVTVAIRILGRVYTSEGAGVLEALESLRVEGKPRTQAILTVTRGQRSLDRILQPHIVARLFSLSPIARQRTLKDLYLMCNI